MRSEAEESVDDLYVRVERAWRFAVTIHCESVAKIRMKLGVSCVKCGKSHLICIRSVYPESTRRISDLRTTKLPFNEAVLKTGPAVSTSGTAVLCYRFALPSASRCSGLGGGSAYACTVAQENFYKETSGVPRILFGGGSTNSAEGRGQRERGSGGGSPLVRCSGGSCNLVQEISFHIVKFS